MELKLVDTPVNPKHYHGTPCKKCGGTLRWNKKSNNCVACHRDRARQSYHANIEESRAVKRAQYRNNRDALIAAAKVHRLRRVYSTTPEEIARLVELQGGKCAICARTPDKLHIDHCHSYGHVRGLLCSNCNTGLGHFKDSEENLLSAIAYLNRPQKATNAA